MTFYIHVQLSVTNFGALLAGVWGCYAFDRSRLYKEPDPQRMNESIICTFAIYQVILPLRFALCRVGMFVCYFTFVF